MTRAIRKGVFPVGFERIDPSALIPLAEVGRRLGWGSRSMAQATQKDGLRTIRYGNRKLVTGRWLLEFVQRLIDQQGEADA